MTLHDTLRRLMLAVDRVGGRLEAAVGGARGFYTIRGYSPSEELKKLYGIYVANTKNDYTIVFPNNVQFQINKELACMLSEVIDTKNRRWTGPGHSSEMDVSDDVSNFNSPNHFDMPDVKPEEFTALLALACGNTNAVRADSIQRYIKIALQYWFVESFQKALQNTAIRCCKEDVTDIVREARNEVHQMNIEHMNALVPVQAAESSPTLYLFSHEHIQDYRQLQTGRYYGCKQFRDGGRDEIVLALFLDVAFDKMRAYVRINDRVEYAFFSHLYHVLPFDHIRPIGMKPSEGYFQPVQFDRNTYGDCVGQYFECNGERLSRLNGRTSASRSIMVLLLGYSGPNTACVLYNDKAWYIQTDYLSIVMPDTLTPDEEIEQNERNELIKKTKLENTEVKCDGAAITDTSQLQKGKLYGFPHSSLSTSGRSFAVNWYVSVMYLGPCIKHPDMVYIFYDNEEHFVRMSSLYRIKLS